MSAVPLNKASDKVPILRTESLRLQNLSAQLGNVNMMLRDLLKEEKENLPHRIYNQIENIKQRTLTINEGLRSHMLEANKKETEWPERKPDDKEIRGTLWGDNPGNTDNLAQLLILGSLLDTLTSLECTDPNCDCKK